MCWLGRGAGWRLGVGLGRVDGLVRREGERPGRVGWRGGLELVCFDFELRIWGFEPSGRRNRYLRAYLVEG